jgi:drug/metabolite transporter (DMT)-like permease
VASVATKVSLIIPVIFAIYLYGDTLNILKVAGITIALLSVALTFYKPGYKLSKSWKIIALPIILFLGTGLLDTILKYTQERVISAEDFNRFSTVLFAVAGPIGFVVAGLNIVIYKTKFSIKSVYAGVLLGLPNYGSIYFLLQAFENSGMKSSVLFPVNNISIVVFSALTAIVFFKEKVSKLNMLGILLALVSIAIISVA